MSFNVGILPKIIHLNFILYGGEKVNKKLSVWYEITKLTKNIKFYEQLMVITVKNN